ncbi:GlxA family transcriptional regulator [Aquabacterium sp.]|uniref:GlxA family transcriptional regulator n=1 Tax=Aquabacterium sp. TaxID=1872578 RepID=UPI002CAB210E|nr:helix-turn-helix domain-containing protein [Aquabacterium sp.]HSW05417.1 helix-turn-helix domain-containing protein [Aquabacterium sp.]
MITIALLLCPSTVPSSLAMALDVFQLANQVASQAPGGAPLFRLQRISIDARPIDSPLGRLNVDGGLDGAARADLLLVPAVGHQLDAVIADNRQLIDWLRLRRGRRTNAAGAASSTRAAPPRFASLCSGAFVLAAAGLLDGRRATTHWTLEALFRRRFPQVRLAIDALLTQDGDVCCSGGAYAGLDLCLHLVRLCGGEGLARQVANLLVIDDLRTTQLRYAPRVPAGGHGDGAIQRLQRWLDGHYADSVTLEQLAERTHCSPRTLLRRFKAATGLTPIDYLQRVRVTAAEAQLGDGRQTVETVAWAVGYEDRAAFAKIFKRLTGESPAAYGRRARALTAESSHPAATAR